MTAPWARIAPAAILALAAVLRFATLGLQSYEADEAVTVDLLGRDLGDMVAAIPDSESTPPLYYVLAWGWTRVLGSTSEVALRSLSALAGVALVYVGYRLVASAVSRRAALVVALLLAVNPFLVWFSQEARAYALVALLCALSLWAFAIALRRPSGRVLVLWAVTSAAALATHYFAVFPVAAEAVWLIAAGRRDRRLLAAVGAVGAAGLALLPLAAAQKSNAAFAPLLESSGTLATRAAQIPKQFLLGYDAPLELVLGLAAAVLALVGAVLWWRGRPALPVVAVGAIAAAVPLALAPAGLDLVVSRNLIVVVLPLAAAIGSGMARTRTGLAAAAALAVLSVAVLVAQAVEPRYQRDDWRGVAEALGESDRPRLVAIDGPGTYVSLRPYRPEIRAAAPEGERVDEILLVTMAARDRPGERRVPEPDVGGAVLVARGDTFVVHRLPVDPPAVVRPDAVAPAGQAALLPPAG